MADSKPSWKAEEEEDEEDYDETVGSQAPSDCAELTIIELRLSERCRTLRDRCQLVDACTTSSVR